MGINSFRRIMFEESEDVVWFSWALCGEFK